MNYILIPLRNKDELVYTKVDMEDAAKACKYKWSFVNGYARAEDTERKTLSLHRLVLGLTENDAVEVDHINRDKLDNRKYNLRIATRGQNNINALHTGKNKYRGVHQRSQNSFRAAISIGTDPSKKILVGGFKTAEEAARAYNELAIKHHGKFAVLNEVPELVVTE